MRRFTCRRLSSAWIAALGLGHRLEEVNGIETKIEVTNIKATNVKVTVVKVTHNKVMVIRSLLPSATFSPSPPPPLQPKVDQVP